MNMSDQQQPRTGPEHYRMAQALIESAARDKEANAAERTLLVQMAQVHATLALAAAALPEVGPSEARERTEAAERVTHP